MASDSPTLPAADTGHKPVMLDEVVEWLALRDGDVIM